jgi:hypothetical protein
MFYKISPKFMALLLALFAIFIADTAHSQDTREFRIRAGSVPQAALMYDYNTFYGSDDSTGGFVVHGDNYRYSTYVGRFKFGNRKKENAEVFALPGGVCRIVDVQTKELTYAKASDLDASYPVYEHPLLANGGGQINERTVFVLANNITTYNGKTQATVIVSQLLKSDTKLGPLLPAVEYSDKMLPQQRVTTGDILWVGNNGYKVLNIVPPDPDKHVIGWVDISKEPVEVKK